jgi:hypothetical protein
MKMKINKFLLINIWKKKQTVEHFLQMQVEIDLFLSDQHRI